MPYRDALDLPAVLVSAVDAVRNPRALQLLLTAFASAGLLLAMGQSSLVNDRNAMGVLQLLGALLLIFYGANAAGVVMMDEARGLPPRSPADAVRAALRTGHRLLLVLAGVALVLVLLAGALAALLWLCRVSVSGHVAGPVLFGLVLPAGTVACAFALLALTAVVPLAAPAVWAGAGSAFVWRQLWGWTRRRLPVLALAMGAVSALTAAVGALVTFAVAAGGRVVAQLAVVITGVDVPAQELTAGLFGYGLRTLGAAGAPSGSTGHAAAALVGGGVVFVVALVLPGLVYLRTVCAVYLALAHASRA